MSKKKTDSDTRTRNRHSNYRPWLRLFKRLAVLCAVLLIGFLLWRNWEKIAPEALLDWTEQQFGDVEAGEGFPCGVAGNSVIAMSEVNQHLAVLSDTSLRFYNASAACVAERAHSFTDPYLCTAGKYVLLAEIGGSRIRWDTRRETVGELELENRKIHAADLLSNGTVALVLNSTSQSYLSEITVMTIQGKTEFSYQSSKYLLTDVSLSPDGRKLAVLGTTAENGVLKSSLLVITLSSGEVKEYTGTDVLLHTVHYYSSGCILAVGDCEIWSLSSAGSQPEIISCDGYEPVGYAVTSSLFGVALRRSGSTDSGELWLFNTGGKRMSVSSYTGAYRSLSAKGTTALLLTDQTMYETKLNGSETQYKAPSDSLKAVLYRGSPLLLTLSELKRAEN